ncbi:MAG: MBL fold metallo-hydrolase [Myxococcota bacterium]
MRYVVTSVLCACLSCVPGGPAGTARVVLEELVPDGGPFNPGPEPGERLPPVRGELTVIQLALPPGPTLKMGEAAILVGPDGTVVLVDVGSSAHDDDVRDALSEVNAALGRPARQVEWVVLTHFHGDHVGAVADLLDGNDALQVVHGVVHRGLVDVGPGANEDDVEALCQLLRGPLASVDRPLCRAAGERPCGGDGDVHAAVECAGLQLGNLLSTEDDALQETSFIPLGDGARLTLLGADGFISNGAQPVAPTAFGHHDTNEENARSVVAWVAHGAFRYFFAGDLTGSGASGEPDVESPLVGAAQDVFFGVLGADVIHASHHARKTSSNVTLVAALAPSDGKSRNVLAGINEIYVGSPHDEVVRAWADGARLGSGMIWVTDRAPGGATHAALVEADGDVVVQTVQGGRGYRVQAAGGALRSQAFESVRAQ